MVNDYREIDLDTLTFSQFFPNQMPKTFWEKSNRFSFDFSEVAFVNWNAGGVNSISGLLDIRLSRTYEKGFIKWNNELLINYGLSKQENTGWRKTNDDLELVSTFGYKFRRESDWYYTVRASFKSQFAKGYNYPNRDESISHFMAPGYFFLGAGAEYKIDKNDMLVYLSPLTQKATFVLNQRLANQGAFGVREAVTDASGDIIQKGKKIRNETGILIKNELRKEVFEDIEVFSRLSLFTDYFKNFGNIDVDWELIIDFKVNSFVKARIGSHIRYDDDIGVQETNENGETTKSGPRVQWKQQLGIGVLIEL
ncbi:MAG: DUF3078 domain-containing protein [Bacteroidota bacterium]